MNLDGALILSVVLGIALALFLERLFLPKQLPIPLGSQMPHTGDPIRDYMNLHFPD